MRPELGGHRVGAVELIKESPCLWARLPVESLILLGLRCTEHLGAHEVKQTEDKDGGCHVNRGLQISLK